MDEIKSTLFLKSVEHTRALVDNDTVPSHVWHPQAELERWIEPPAFSRDQSKAGQPSLIARLDEYLHS
jgi:hypothetical protein